MNIKIGDKGLQVAKIQSKLKNLGFDVGDIDSDFGIKTRNAVIKYKESITDGEIDEYWFNKLINEKEKEKPEAVVFKNFHLTKGEYFDEITKKTQICIHLTAGWANPYLTVRGWENDGGSFQLPVATPYVIGGKYYKNDKVHNDLWTDGDIISCFDDKKYAYHIGLGNENIEKRCIGIEVCNFASLTKKGDKFYAWNNAEISQDEIEKINFRGIDFWQKITESQILSLRKLILYLADKHKINVKRKYDNNWSNYNLDVISGKTGGVVTHTNFIHPDRYLRFDTPPFDNLIYMLNSL